MIERTFILLASGLAFSGKDSVAEVLEAHGYFRTAFAKSLKRTAGRLFGLDGERMIHDPAYKVQCRELLIWFGKMVRSRDQDAWVRQVHLEISGQQPAPERVVVSDFRFANEMLALSRWGYRVMNLRVTASEEVRRTRMGGPAWERYQASTATDSSETGLDSWAPDFTLSNEGSLSDLASSLGGRVQDFEARPALPRPPIPDTGPLTGVLEPSYECLEKQVKLLEEYVADAAAALGGYPEFPLLGLR